MTNPTPATPEQRIRIPLDELVLGRYVERNHLLIVGGDPDLHGNPWRPKLYLAPAEIWCKDCGSEGVVEIGQNVADRGDLVCVFCGSKNLIAAADVLRPGEYTTGGKSDADEPDRRTASASPASRDRRGLA